VVADALFHVEVFRTPVSPEVLAEAEVGDTELVALLQGSTALQLEKIPIPG
jgi:hypothetical protein